MAFLQQCQGRLDFGDAQTTPRHHSLAALCLVLVLALMLATWFGETSTFCFANASETSLLVALWWVLR